MNPSRCIGCTTFPCTEVQQSSYILPDLELEPEKISIFLISEAAPASAQDTYYAAGLSLFQRTTVLAFKDAGCPVASIQDLLERGVYLTTAIKCGKTGYTIPTGAVKECSYILEQELALFPNAKVLLLMGDVAIKALNFIARRHGVSALIPPISTYKLRGQEFTFEGKRVFPSYLQAGPSFFIEKSKRQMIAEDLAAALNFIEEN